MKITVTCPQCGQKFSKEFDATKVNRVIAGELVQNVFPELSSEERELYFISHICPTCWDNLFGVEEYDYDEDYAIPQDIIEEMVETYHKMHTEIARGK